MDEYRDTAQTSSDQQTPDDSQPPTSTDDAGRPAASVLIEDEPESASPPRPRRMTFRKPA
ncbi:MAG: hypothetical protein VW989_14675, partial [Rhodobiaceae bacterium]